MRSTLLNPAWLTCAAVWGSACSGTDGGSTQAAGGALNNSTGGETSIGTLPIGGSTASGTTSGGTNVGGAQNLGGSVLTGGARATGGNSSALGGAQSTGGRATGGSPGSGGNVTGGALATGGTQSITGGNRATGGTLATGGAAAAGGATTTGGAPGTGGTKATGGSAATSGSSGAGQGGTTQLTPQQAVKLHGDKNPRYAAALAASGSPDTSPSAHLDQGGVLWNPFALIDPLAGDFAKISPTRQRIYLAVKTKLGSSTAIPSLGLTRPGKIDASFKLNMEGEIRRGLFAMTQAKEIFVISVTVTPNNGKAHWEVVYIDLTSVPGVEFGKSEGEPETVGGTFIISADGIYLATTTDGTLGTLE